MDGYTTYAIYTAGNDFIVGGLTDSDEYGKC